MLAFGRCLPPPTLPSALMSRVLSPDGLVLHRENENERKKIHIVYQTCSREIGSKESSRAAVLRVDESVALLLDSTTIRCSAFFALADCLPGASPSPIHWWWWWWSGTSVLPRRLAFILTQRAAHVRLTNVCSVGRHAQMMPSHISIRLFAGVSPIKKHALF